MLVTDRHGCTVYEKCQTREVMMSSFQWMAGASTFPTLKKVIIACRVAGLRTCLIISYMLSQANLRLR
jgi:hypothetical protein